MKFTSNKVIDLGSAAFRQWRSTHSHCQYMHGYRLTANITFECDALDERNWVMDFGGLKHLKKILENTFDHKLVVAGDDPQLELFKQLDAAGVAKLVVLDAGVGCELFAEFVLKTADTFVDEVTGGRVRVQQVQINEHESNFATCHRPRTESKVTFLETSDSTEPTLLEDVEELIDTTTEVNNPTTSNPHAASVGKKPSTSTKAGWFEGTTWG
ncbi:6-carboxytetrahydropterin synthase [bacterium]|nr:6-carboxytetrahydropterin synthase [bacterium]